MACQIIPLQTLEESSANKRESGTPSNTEFGAQPVRVALGQHLPGILRRAKMDVGLLTPSEILALQRTIGNQAVAGLIAEARQQKLKSDVPRQSALPTRMPGSLYRQMDGTGITLPPQFTVGGQVRGAIRRPLGPAPAPAIQRDKKKTPKADGGPEPTAASAPKLDLTLSKNGDPCACVVVVHNDEQNARKTAQLMSATCAYNLALVQPDTGSREVKIPGEKGTVDPNSLFPPDIAAMCMNDEQNCREFLKNKSGTTDRDEIKKFVDIEFFLTIYDCSKGFSLPVVALHNNDLQDTKNYLKQKDKAGTADLKQDIDKSDPKEGKAQVQKLKDLMEKKFGPDIEKQTMETAGKTNIFRWCASKDLSKCHIGDPDHPDNITWVTNADDFARLSAQPINVALQSEMPAKGSESEGDLSTLFLILRSLLVESRDRLIQAEQAQIQADTDAIKRINEEMEKLNKFGDLTPRESQKDQVLLQLRVLDQLLAWLLLVLGVSASSARIEQLRYVNVETPGKGTGDQTDAERVRNYESIVAVLKGVGLHCCGADPAAADGKVREGLKHESK